MWCEEYRNWKKQKKHIWFNGSNTNLQYIQLPDPPLPLCESSFIQI